MLIVWVARAGACWQIQITIKKTIYPVLIYSGLYKGELASTVGSFEIGCVERSYPPSCFRSRAILPRDERLPGSGPADFSKRPEGKSVVDRGTSAAFTLIEVVIAVGLVAFVLTAILGLVAIAANETKNADLKARLTWITEQVTSEYQSQRFSSVLPLFRPMVRQSTDQAFLLGLFRNAG